MKATFSLVFAFILSHQVLFSQSNVSIGLIGGPTIAKFWDTPNGPFPMEWMPAFSVGTAIRVNLKKQFFFQTELTYERKGYSWGEVEWTDFNAVPIGKSALHHQFNYVLLTPTIGYSTLGKIRFEGSVGFFGGYLMDSKFKFTSTSSVFKEPAFIQSSASDFNRFDVGSTMRLGVGFDLGKKWAATINSVGNLGFAKPNKTITGQPTDSNTAKTVSWGVQFGVFYKI